MKIKYRSSGYEVRITDSPHPGKVWMEVYKSAKFLHARHINEEEANSVYAEEYINSLMIANLPYNIKPFKSILE